MYQVLLVDDEPSHLIGLSKLLSRMKPNYIIHTARNGKEALHACASNEYQIIISDIEMPVLDGLNFVEQLKKRGQPMKIIYLTGYNHFEYAQRAIGLGSFDYVLKPVDIAKFTAVIERAEQELDREIRRIQDHVKLEARMKSAAPVYRNRILYEWLSVAKCTPATFAELNELGIDGSGFISVTEFLEIAEISDHKKQGWRLEFQNTLEQLLLKRGVCYTFMSEYDPNRLIAVSQANIDVQLKDELACLMEASAAPGYSLCMGLSAWSDNLYELGPKLYCNAKNACETGFYLESRRPILEEEACVDPNMVLIATPKDEALLTEAVFGAGSQNSQTVFTEMFERLKRSGRYPMTRELVRYIQNLLSKLIQSNEFLNKEARELLILRVRTALERQPGIGALRMKTVKLAVEIAEAVAEARKEHKETLIYRCLAYIDEHYMDDLSLESVAAAFNFNAAYFSHYFKNKLNINFSQYLTQVRLSKAKEFLEHSEERVYQVAARLGYNDVKYFNRVFKKEFGITPEEFRSISRELRRGNNKAR